MFCPLSVRLRLITVTDCTGTARNVALRADYLFASRSATLYHLQIVTWNITADRQTVLKLLPKHRIVI